VFVTKWQAQRYTSAMDFKSASKTLILALASGSFALTALAQWQWIDKDGRKVFSDRAPPVDTPVKNILKQPASKAAAAPSFGESPPAAAASAAASSPAAKASAPKISGKDAELEAAKKKADEEAAAKKKAEQETREKALAESCQRAQKSLITLQSGIRMATTNAQGERDFMDDATRAAETKRVQAIVASDCKK
jgi:hypothetical protein